MDLANIVVYTLLKTQVINEAVKALDKPPIAYTLQSDKTIKFPAIDFLVLAQGGNINDLKGGTYKKGNAEFGRYIKEFKLPEKEDFLGETVYSETITFFSIIPQGNSPEYQIIQKKHYTYYTFSKKHGSKDNKLYSLEVSDVKLDEYGNIKGKGETLYYVHLVGGNTAIIFYLDLTSKEKPPEAINELEIETTGKAIGYFNDLYNKYNKLKQKQEKIPLPLKRKTKKQVTNPIHLTNRFMHRVQNRT